MIPASFAPYKWVIVAGGIAAVAISSFGAGWLAQGWRKDATIATAEAAKAKGEATAAGAELTQFKAAAAVITAAASDAHADNTITARELRAIRMEMKNAKPLPADCVPDAGRLRQRNAAIEAYNRAATGQLPGGTLQDH